jgi:hypothetical protein
MKQKKKQEKNEYRITGQMFLAEGVVLLCNILTVGLVSFFQNKPIDIIVRNLILSVAGVAILGFTIRQAYMFDELDYDNKENYLRFWFCFLMGLIGAVVCAFLPAGGWPYMPIYVLLALFSNMSSGIIGGSVLLMISTLLSEVNLGVSFLYFVSGIFAITLFVHLSGEFKVGVRLMLALLCLLLCETEGTVLLANERFRPELFVIPLANCILSGIILLLIMNLFSSKVIFRFRGVYLDLNDTENEILSKFRAESKQDYMHSVHTA